YQAWAAGDLTRDDLREYSRNYYHHVEAFPGYLAQFGIRLDEGSLRRAVLANLADETGTRDSESDSAPAHSELWLDFVEGMGSNRALHGHKPVPEIKQLMEFFYNVASEGAPEEALAAFYAYESQVPRIAKEKARGLRELYGASEKTCAYFTLHTTADIFHSQVWLRLLRVFVESNPEASARALNAAENASMALWRALDGVEATRTAKAAA
ncbi:MAG: iron-containing redox enzyme family protein, partial [Acidobacteriota bacterium]|nr:iron-containing redox enzyme family protein [Acidobacteriota bacterium]